MLGLGFTEILVILAVALFVLGPQHLPQVAQTLGKSMREFRQAADQVTQTVLFPPLEYENSFPETASMEAGAKEVEQNPLQESTGLPLTEGNPEA